MRGSGSRSGSFYQAIGRWAQVGKDVVTELGVPALAKAGDYFAGVGRVASTLGEMAELQRMGQPFTPAHLAFINELVKVGAGCTSSTQPGWYLKMFFDPDSAMEQRVVIADVFTQPTDAAGNLVGNVLHVGTGFPRLMLVTVDSCQGQGLRVYAGPVSAYYETTTQNFQRLDDDSWTKQLVRRPPPADPEFMQGLLAK